VRTYRRHDDGADVNKKHFPKRSKCKGACGGYFTEWDHIAAKKQGQTCADLVRLHEKGLAWLEDFDRRVASKAKPEGEFNDAPF